ncbi:MAG: hypothetical protein IJ358_02050 [Clostridia bacterium]|nr:hypothetical protein [Clostridia bacterium]
MSEEIKNVLNGKYNNPKLDAYMDDLLLASMLRLDMSTYMATRELRTNVILGAYENIHEVEDEEILGL